MSTQQHIKNTEAAELFAITDSNGTIVNFRDSRTELFAMHIKNTQAALDFWATVPAETVIKDLCDFRTKSFLTERPSCDSPACFGGWLPYAKHFAALGVIARSTGSPTFSTASGALTSGEVSSALFGHYYMFSPREHGLCGTDHEVITARLRAHLAYLISANE